MTCEDLAYVYRQLLDSEPALKQRLDSLTQEAAEAEKLRNRKRANQIATQVAEFERELAQREINAALATGRLIIPVGKTLTIEESSFVGQLIRENRHVEVVLEAGEQGVEGVRTMDYVIDGVQTEGKTVLNITSPDPSGALNRIILGGAGQAPHIIVDVQRQAEITAELAERAILRAFGRQRQLGNKRIQTVHVIGRGFDITKQYIR